VAGQIRQQRAHAIIQGNLQRRRSAIITVVPAAPPKTTTMGYTVAKTFTIHESEPADGVVQFELLVNDESVWVGMGDDRVEGLLRVIMGIMDADNEVRTVVPAVLPNATTMGYTVAKTFTIHESELVDGVVQFELLVNGESVWVGMGDDRADGLLRVIMKITGQDEEPPDN
jgi:hypothetical protein